MIKHILVLFICCFGLSVNAQYDGKGENESSRFRPGIMWFYSGLRPAQEGKPTKYDRLIFDIVYNDWAGDEGPFQNNWASIGLNSNIMFDIPLDRKNRVSLGVGVSHQYTPIRHNNHLISNETENTTTFVLKDSTDVFKNSSLVGNSFSIPIEIRFRNESWKHFKIHIGGKIGYQANLYSRYVSAQGGHEEVTKRYGFTDGSKLLYSAHVRIGLRNFGLFASYNFNRIFSNSNSTKLNLLQMGLSVSLF